MSDVSDLSGPSPSVSVSGHPRICSDVWGATSPPPTRYHLTGVRIMGPVGIGEVQITAFFYGTKSLLKMSFRILLIFVGWGFNRR